ncbi:hypothetical protein Asppvi_002220 [Aspergillus pseudoviridinutans]|uniref:Uncharacterized protein n=1 Tax=Aspergillus pseudoviridinutans TaxID=1517512 RepID=A0A9P3B635_9EURO|nr:uncharacterized protein Asppvi_002220 [Aspergillus pseudoviridinutans]GIJ83400.1 hypothetical protein Asppvi_002220 [Aspergillus pseudoviridinutans]
MSSNYNLRSGNNPTQDQPGAMAGGMGGDQPEFQSQGQQNPEFQSEGQQNPEFQSQGQQNPDLQSQRNPRMQSQTNQKSQQSSFQTSESSKQTSSNDVQWGNQPGQFSASETNPKPPGSYHLTGDQLSHPQE